MKKGIRFLCFELNYYRMSLLIKEFFDFKQLGKGGMDNTFLATQIIPNRKVVIKKFLLNTPQAPDLIKRLKPGKIGSRIGP